MRFCARSEIPKNDLIHLFSNSYSHWFHQTDSWIDYTLKMRNYGSKDLSFGVYVDNKLVAFAPLIKEYMLQNSCSFEFSMAGIPSVTPTYSNLISPNLQKRIETQIFNKIFRLVESENISYINMHVPPLTDDILNQKIKMNPLLKFSFNDTSLTTNILRLEKNTEAIFKKFRKGTKSEIKTAMKNNLESKIFDSKNISREKFELYKGIHFQASGRQTRPDATWDLMFDWVKSGQSILSLTYQDDEAISAQLINTYRNKAFYHSGATLPSNSRQRGVGHLAQWEIIKYLCGLDFQYYDLGLNMHSALSQEVVDSKLLGISKFKAGFGALIFPYLRGEWFRDKELMMQIYKARIDQMYALRDKTKTAMEL